MEFIVEILNWSNYNPRPDRGNFSWFRMDNQFFVHMRQRKGASADATILLALLLAECSTANGAPFKFRLAFAAELLRRPEKKMLEALREIEKMGDCVLKPASSGLDAGFEPRQNGQNGQDRTDTAPPRAPAFDFEKIYMAYPRKEGKKRGLELCLRQIKTPDDYLKLERAVARYVAKLRAEGTAPQYVKQFSTFMSSWTDWLDQDAGKVRLHEPPRPQPKPPEPEFIPSEPDPESLALIKKAMGGFIRPMPR